MLVSAAAVVVAVAVATLDKKMTVGARSWRHLVDHDGSRRPGILLPTLPTSGGPTARPPKRVLGRVLHEANLGRGRGEVSSLGGAFRAKREKKY